jgi:electron transfer flavoprotein beta subunit
VTVAVAGATRCSIRERPDPRLNILVCVKRVPQTGGRIVLTRRWPGDRHALPRRHDQPARGVRRRGGRSGSSRRRAGSSTVLTLGPAEAEEQLRDAMAIGIEKAILLETQGGEWDPVSTAAAIAETIEARRRRTGPST